MVDDVFPIDRVAAERAKAIVLARRPLSARDAIHVAVMEQYGVTRILSFDAGFDGIPGIQRLTMGAEWVGPPARVGVKIRGRSARLWAVPPRTTALHQDTALMRDWKVASVLLGRELEKGGHHG